MADKAYEDAREILFDAQRRIEKEHPSFKASDDKRAFLEAHDAWMLLESAAFRLRIQNERG